MLTSIGITIKFRVSVPFYFATNFRAVLKMSCSPTPALLGPAPASRTASGPYLEAHAPEIDRQNLFVFFISRIMAPGTWHTTYDVLLVPESKSMAIEIYISNLMIVPATHYLTKVRPLRSVSVAQSCCVGVDSSSEVLPCYASRVRESL